MQIERIDRIERIQRTSQGPVDRPTVGRRASAARAARITYPIVLTVVVACLAACSPNVQDAPPRPPITRSSSSAPSASSGAPSSVASAPLAPRSTSACELHLPAPMASAPSPPPPGPVYVLVKHTGVLRIGDDGVSVAKKMDDESTSPWNTSVVVGPTGELWTSDWRGVSVVGRGKGAARSARSVKDGPLYEQLAVRSPTDVWAVTSDIEWSIVHYNGKAWAPVRSRPQFKGRYDDNKFESLRVTSDAVWASTWNGLWRGAGAAAAERDWQKIEPPGGLPAVVNLFVYRDKLVADYQDGLYLREGASWRKTSVPESIGHVWAVSDLGVVAGGGSDNTRVLLAAIDGDPCIVTSAPLSGGVIHDIAIDQSGRIWVATDFRISVLDRAANVIAEWAPGALDGFVGDAWRVAVASGGPQTLPSPKVPRTIDVIGRMVTYKGNSSLSGAGLELCASPSEARGCAGSSFSLSAKVEADGSFRFHGVPDGDFGIYINIPPGTEDCEGIFRDKGDYVSLAKDCKTNPKAPGVCDLGTLTECLPFEMPPPYLR